MTKKNWISVKRGLSEDPKHREAMGGAVWLYLHIIDAADWEKGIVYDWRDKDIADDMSINQRTIRDWRDRLISKGYITCERRPHSLNIIIHNWTDPRSYSGKKLNINQSDITMSNTKKVIDTVIDTVIDQDSTGEPASFIQSTSTSTSKSALSPKDLEQVNKKVDAILENEKKAASSWTGRESIPEPIRELLDVYVKVTGQKPTKGQLIDWLSSGGEWLELGAVTVDIENAYKKARPVKGDGFMVTRPGSLTTTIGMLVGERRTKGSFIRKNDPMESFNKYRKAKNGVQTGR